jgi:cell division protein FtsQ
MSRSSPLNASRSAPRSTGERPAKTARSRKSPLPLGGRKPPKPQRGMPPVMVRGIGTRAEQPAARKQGRARRRYDVALSIPGAEVRLPALPELRLGWRLLSGFMVLVLAGLLYFAWTDPIFQVETLQVSGIKRITPADFEKALGIIGEPVFTLRPQELRQDLHESFKELSVVDVKVALPAQVIIEVVERDPVLSWHVDGKEIWVDAEGYAFLPRSEVAGLVAVEGSRPAMPVPAEGEEQPLFADPDLIAAVIHMAGYMPPDTPVMYDSQYGLGWNDWHGWQVYFGFDTKQIEMKMRVYEALVDNLYQQNIYPKLISVEYIHAPYYRLER